MGGLKLDIGSGRKLEMRVYHLRKLGIVLIDGRPLFSMWDL